MGAEVQSKPGPQQMHSLPTTTPEDSVQLTVGQHLFGNSQTLSHVTLA